MDQFNLIVKETSEYMLKNNVKENDMIQSARKQFSPFGLISKKLTGNYCFKTTMRLLMQWKRDQKGFLIFKIKNIFLKNLL
jgi:hypothetical protein